MRQSLPAVKAQGTPDVLTPTLRQMHVEDPVPLSSPRQKDESAVTPPKWKTSTLKE